MENITERLGVETFAEVLVSRTASRTITHLTSVADPRLVKFHVDSNQPVLATHDVLGCIARLHREGGKYILKGTTDTIEFNSHRVGWKKLLSEWLNFVRLEVEFIVQEEAMTQFRKVHDGSVSDFLGAETVVTYDKDSRAVATFQDLVDNVSRLTLVRNGRSFAQSFHSGGAYYFDFFGNKDVCDAEPLSTDEYTPEEVAVYWLSFASVAVEEYLERVRALTPLHHP